MDFFSSSEERFYLQGIVAQINQAIGATGVVSNECKMVVQQYGDQIVEMLLEQVNFNCWSLGSAVAILIRVVLSIM